MKPKCLDLFCGAGGATKGLQQAGFHVTGVDINPQPRYVGDEFHQADAMAFPLEGFDFIWASPPCQRFTSLRTMPNAKEHADLIAPTRERLNASGVDWVIENVVGAPLRSPFMLCGTMFGLKNDDAELRRHWIFEASAFFLINLRCRHYEDRPQVVGVYGGGVHVGRPARRPRTVGVWGNAGGFSIRDGVQQFTTDERAQAMGIDWMTGKELAQAIPPTYSKYIGEQMMPHVLRRMAVPA